MKKLILLLSVFLIILTHLSANPAALNFDNLANDEKFESLLLDFLDAYPYIKFSDYQNKESHNEQIENTEKLYNFLENKKNLNYDEKLLQFLCARCLYNFDLLSYEEVFSLFTKIDFDYPNNAYHHWIYGNFLASVGSEANKGLKELEKYMHIKDYYVNEAFLEDYAYCQVLCGLRLNAYFTITNGKSILEENVRNQSLLKIIKDNILESSSKENYDANVVWKLSNLEEDYNYVYSTMLGVSFPCKGNWYLKFDSFKENSPAMCIISPNDFKIEEDIVTISILLLVYPQSLYATEKKDKLLNSFKILNTENVEISNHTFEKYTYENLEQYNDKRNGSRGYIYYGKIDGDKYSGANCEHAIDWFEVLKNSNEESSGSQKFFKITKSQKRLSEPIHFFILVDSCNALIDETDDLLEKLFSRAIFE